MTESDQMFVDNHFEPIQFSLAGAVERKGECVGLCVDVASAETKFDIAAVTFVGGVRFSAEMVHQRLHIARCFFRLNS